MLNNKKFKCVVNENAYDTWLEPYIGWDFPILKITQNTVYFFMDCGYDKLEIKTHNKNIFNIIEDD